MHVLLRNTGVVDHDHVSLLEADKLFIMFVAKYRSHGSRILACTLALSLLNSHVAMTSPIENPTSLKSRSINVDSYLGLKW